MAANQVEDALAAAEIAEQPIAPASPKPYIFDIFKRVRNGKTIWITAVQGMEEARIRADQIASVVPGDYFIHSQKSGLIEYVDQSGSTNGQKV